MDSSSTLHSNALPTAGPSAGSPGGNPALGAAILSVFGTFWLAMGCASDPRGTPILVIAIVICGVLLLATSLWIMRATRAHRVPVSAAENKHIERVFRNVNIAQWVAVPVMIVLLNLAGHTQWITAGIILVVGVHFIPLARLFRRREHLLIGIIFIAIALIGPWVAPTGVTSSLLPIAAGLTLWTAVLYWLKSAYSSRE